MSSDKASPPLKVNPQGHDSGLSPAVEMPQDAAGQEEDRKLLGKAAAASFIGNFVEWYDSV